MKTQPVDPRDMTWEQDQAVYRVHFWDRSAVASYEYEVTGADVGEVLGWARGRAEAEGWAFTLYVRVDGGDGPGLVRLCGVAGEPFGTELNGPTQ
ncbi:hypothetical protein I5Q34_17615 [Streptomyces sp. AV19]|uniref:hypothetical protein n=1 Tax=Streptomyces sp. AV19 TaxID=2793068 RepID=UPI0018FE515E|nr:hypothetical protein [Streptomyces sp. AV19]MBH1936065.1 hypothetical protein [Streptomyces sp. AV19]MDG4534141.1 hypothetical protein [Streptomyces sp. AV19]